MLIKKAKHIPWFYTICESCGKPPTIFCTIINILWDLCVQTYKGSLGLFSNLIIQYRKLTNLKKSFLSLNLIIYNYQWSTIIMWTARAVSNIRINVSVLFLYHIYIIQYFVVFYFDFWNYFIQNLFNNYFI